MLRTEPTAEDSLALILARSRFGIAIAAMIKMIATTISNSINEKPFCLRILFPSSWFCRSGPCGPPLNSDLNLGLSDPCRYVRTRFSIAHNYQSLYFRKNCILMFSVTCVLGKLLRPSGRMPSLPHFVMVCDRLRQCGTQSVANHDKMWQRRHSAAGS